MRPPGAPPRWEPSLDFNVFKRFPCNGDDASPGAVEMLVQNLRAHYKGNRAPFHIGLHAQNYTADDATLHFLCNAVLDQVGAPRVCTLFTGSWRPSR